MKFQTLFNLLITSITYLTLNFIQLNDIHLNLINSPPTERNSEPQQFFNLIRNIKKIDKSNKIEFILDSGDVIRHGKKRESVGFDELKSIRAMYYYYIDFELNKASYFPTIGNNDIFPKDHLRESNHQFKLLKSEWSKFNLNLTKGFLKGGYYNKTIELSKTLSFSIASLNTILWSTRNKYNRENCKSKGIGIKQLDWLNNHLHLMSKSNIKVIILGHIPPLQLNGKLAYNAHCNDKLMKILETYNNTIELGLFGHINKNKTIELVKTRHNGLKFQYSNGGKSYRNQVVLKFMTNLSLFPGKGSYFRLFQVERDKIMRYKQYYLDLAKHKKLDTEVNGDYKVIETINLA